jgi:hypothetical protein
MRTFCSNMAEMFTAAMSLLDILAPVIIISFLSWHKWYNIFASLNILPLIILIGFVYWMPLFVELLNKLRLTRASTSSQSTRA